MAFCDIGLPAGYALPEDVARARAAGFDLHVRKPPVAAEIVRLAANAPVDAEPAPN